MSEPPAKPLNDKPDSTSNNFKKGTSDYDLTDSRCGFLGWEAPWLQWLASKKAFVLVYGLLGLNQALMGTYFIATITTFEKRFKLPSTYSGILSSGWDMGNLAATMFIAYYGSTGHKTKWVGYWAILAAFSCFVRLLPHLIYGPGADTYRPVEMPTNYEAGSPNNTDKDLLCSSPYLHEENCSLNEEGSVAFMIVLIAQILVGIGTSAYFTLGAAYLDDNVLKNKFPFLSGVAACIRWIGPTFGFLLASITLKIYLNPDVTPTFGTDDSRWIGSWHLGWVPIGIIELIMAISISFFPRILPREAIRRQNSKIEAQSKKSASFKDFVQTSKRLFTNRILMLNVFSTTFYMFGMEGYWIFMTKYIETQFRKTAADASIITGTVGLVCTAIGVLTSSAIVSRLKPKVTHLALWNVITESIDVIGHVMFAFIGCQRDDMHGSVDTTGRWLLNQTCNAHCNCSPSIPYNPVCAGDGSQMYFSACHAGCLTEDYLNGTKVYTNCSCVGGSGIALDGPCPIDCHQQFMLFMILLSIMRFLSSTGRAGNIVIQYRSVEPADKSVSIAFFEIALSLFSFIPAPVIFGMIVDSTCQVWGYTCGAKGNCLLYYGQSLRYYLNFTSSGFLLIGVLLDIGVWRSVGSLNIYDDEEVVQQPPPKEIPLTKTIMPEDTNESDNGEELNETSFLNASK